MNIRGTEQKMNARSQLLVSCLLFVLAQSVSATDYYVDKSRPDDSGNGLSVATAKRTIQAAVDLAGDGDTVWCMPGDYDEGGRAPEGINLLTNRVSIIGKNNFTLRSMSGKHVTRIIGAKSRGNGTYGLGDDAVRCIFTDSCSGVRIEGFTIANGATAMNSDSTSAASGGALYARQGVDGDYGKAILADCVITNCSGLYAGAVIGATVLRTHISNCYALRTGRAAYKANLLHCLITHCAGGYAVCREGTYVNCTIAENSANYGIVQNATLLNCAVIMNGDGLVGCGDSSIVARHGVFAKNTGSDFQSIDEGSVIAPTGYQFVAPLYDDYRPLASSALLGVGRAEELGAVGYLSESDRRTDMEGKVCAATGAIAAGCFQTPVAPQGGGIQFSSASGFSTRGLVPYTSGMYAFAESYPTQFLVQGVSTATSRVMYFSIGGSTVYPLIDDSIWITPPAAGTVLTNNVSLTDKILYVNKATGRDDGTHDGTSPSTPFRSIQAAVDACTGGIILVAEGDYDNGGKFVPGKGVTNRVAICSKGGLRLLGAGAGKSIIRGRLATVGTDAAYPGCGTDAVRCCYADCSCAIQGFTLTDGRVLTGTTDVVTSGGGLFAQNNRNAKLLDCVVTNCVGYRGFAMHGGDIRRCKILNCGAGFGALSRYAQFTACIFAGNDCGSGAMVNADSTTAHYGCTFAGRSTSDKMLAATSGQTFYNCIFTKANGINANISLRGCVVYDSQSVGPSTGYIAADPEYTDESAGDVRPLSGSPVFSAGEIFSSFPSLMIGDVDGNPVRFTDGHPAAGACHSSVAALYVEAPSYGTQSYSGTRLLVPGETVTVTAEDGESRHCVGFRVNGEDVLSEPASWSCRLPEILTGRECFKVAPIYSTNWYVNADAAIGNDGNSGFTPTTAKRTLAAIMTCGHLLAGDCVHAAPGIYAEGDMEQKYYGNNDQRTTRVRVCIDEGITLVGDGGAERTVIKGNLEATSESVRFGANPMRCVNLTHGAKIIGFTLTGGSTAYATSSGQNEPYLGGSVIAPVPTYSSRRPLVQDCIISNNWACRGGAAFGASLVNCRIVDNYASEDGTATFLSEMVNCLVDRNRGKSASGCAVVRYPYGIKGCTLTDRNIGEDTGATSTYFIYDYNQYKRGVLNSVVMGGVKATDRIAATNCVFLAGLANYGDESDWDVTTRKLSAAEIMLSDDGRPIADSPVIDKGDNAYVLDIGGRNDAGGGQRIYNGTVDIGCFEYDWRGDYAKAIGGGVSVAKASSGVVLRDGAVRLVGGETLSGEWPATSVVGRYGVPSNVTGSGRLRGTFVNEDLGYYSMVEFVSGSSDYVFRLRDTKLLFEFSYFGEGAASLSGFACDVHGMLLFFR